MCFEMPRDCCVGIAVLKEKVLDMVNEFIFLFADFEKCWCRGLLFPAFFYNYFTWIIADNFIENFMYWNFCAEKLAGGKIRNRNARFLFCCFSGNCHNVIIAFVCQQCLFNNCARGDNSHNTALDDSLCLLWKI